MNATNLSKAFKVGVCQISQVKDKIGNIDIAQKAITEAAKNGAQMVILGEYFNTMYNKEYSIKDAEDLKKPEECPTFQFLQKTAKENNIYLIGGTIPEKEGDYIYNTSLIFNRKGDLIGKHRKVHLFDIDIPGKITFKESDYLKPGNDITIVDTEYGKVGVAICYDMRFPELALLMNQQGAKMIVYAGCFNQTTGPLHWELILRSRALDNQLFVVGSSVARFRSDPNMYQSWGHSLIVDPMGKVRSACEEDEAIIYHDIDMQELEEARQNLPYQHQKRTDVYKLQAL